MPAAIPLWFVASQGPYTVSITPQTVNTSTGALSDGTVATLTTEVEDVNIEGVNDLREISPSTTVRMNHVIVKKGTRVSISEIIKKVGTNKLAAQFYAADYFKVIVVRGAQTFTLYGIAAGYQETIQNDKTLGVFSMEMIDTGETNPVYS